MVDFNKDNTVTTAPADLIKIMILERWNNVIEAIERYQLDHDKGIVSSESYIKSRLLSLINILYGGLHREIPMDVLKAWQNKILKGHFDDLTYVYNEIAIYLDDKRLTRIDTRKQYDSTRVEIENSEKKL